MRYMLMMHAPRGNGEYQVSDWSADDFKAHIAFMHRINQELTAAGEWVGGEGLAAPGDARIVRAGKGGAPAVTDGPYAESKEFLAGFWIVEVDNEQRAHEIAADVRRRAPVHLRPFLEQRDRQTALPCHHDCRAR